MDYGYGTVVIFAMFLFDFGIATILGTAVGMALEARRQSTMMGKYQKPVIQANLVSDGGILEASGRMTMDEYVQWKHRIDDARRRTKNTGTEKT